MEHLTDPLVEVAIEQILGEDSGWKSYGRRVEGWSINVTADTLIQREQIERLRLRLNTIERNAGGSSVLAYWYIRFLDGHFEIRYLKSDEWYLSKHYPEGMLLPMYDDLNGDDVDGRLSFVAYLMCIANSRIIVDDMRKFDFCRDFADRPQDGQYLFCGQKTYDCVRDYLHDGWRDNEALEILNSLVTDYCAFCEKMGLEAERISRK